MLTQNARHREYKPLARHVIVIRFSAGNRKRGIISSPDNQHGRLMITKPFSCQIG